MKQGDGEDPYGGQRKRPAILYNRDMLIGKQSCDNEAMSRQWVDIAPLGCVGSLVSLTYPHMCPCDTF